MTYYPKCIDCASEAQLDEQQVCEECNANRRVYQKSWYQEQEDQRIEEEADDIALARMDDIPVRDRPRMH